MVTLIIIFKILRRTSNAVLLTPPPPKKKNYGKNYCILPERLGAGEVARGAVAAAAGGGVVGEPPPFHAGSRLLATRRLRHLQARGGVLVFPIQVLSGKTKKQCCGDPDPVPFGPPGSGMGKKIRIRIWIPCTFTSFFKDRK